jgi:hypothetical protein
MNKQFSTYGWRGGGAGYSIATQLELTDAYGSAAGYPKFPPIKATGVEKIFSPRKIEKGSFQTR